VNIHDIVNAMGYVYQKVHEDDNAIERCFLIFGADIDEETWKDYKEALAQWHALKDDVEYTMQKLKKYERWLAKMGYDEDIEEDEEEME
jgi:hypothetical protein